MDSKETVSSNYKSFKRTREEEDTTSNNNSSSDASSFVASNNTNVPTATQFIIPPEEYKTLPPELQHVDFTKRISWRKFEPYTNTPLPYTSTNTKPQFTKQFPALCFHINATSKRARATTLHLPSERKVETPIFMPVGTKGTIKSLSTEEIMNDEALNCPIILGNTYHLALQPGTELVRDMGGLHKFMNWNGGILTDSGGFQMVSLLELAEITEEGVTFENPFTANTSFNVNENENEEDDKEKASKGERMLLRPEDSITHQNNIGSDIMMALDDVVSSVAADDERFTIATYRTLRWLDRCFAAHTKTETQNLFAIVQGGLDVSMGGLRDKCLAGFQVRDDHIPGYAIGGLAGGESKDDFWKVVDQCCKALPDDKPRYLMGVGYPLDLVVCSALGVDMYDCVYPTRTARFGVALVRGGSGTMRIKSNEFSTDERVIMDGCNCQACAGGFSRARLHSLLKRGNPLGTALMTHHNIAYMMYLVRGMRKAVIEGRYEDYVIDFMNDHFQGSANGGEDVPKWVCDALNAANINIEKLKK